MKDTYFDWLSKATPTRWWHDSGSPDEIALAKTRGALGVTTNPVLTYRTFNQQPDFWEEKVNAISQDLDLEERAEALLKLIATYAAGQFYDVFAATGGAHGYALGQLNPSRAGDAAAMLAQAKRYHAWAPNIAVKLPSTRAGIEVVEELAALGIPICATLNVSVAQAISVAEAYERGLGRAEAAGVKTAPCFAVQQVGRIDDYLRDVAMDMKLGLPESIITMAGVAVAKRSYQIFMERGYRAVIMPAGLRGHYHLAEMAGAEVVFSITTRVQDMVLAADPPREARIETPVAEDILEQLMQMSEFRRAYEPEGLQPREFITFGVMQKLLSQFAETGWAPLETYKSNKLSGRWI